MSATTRPHSPAAKPSRADRRFFIGLGMPALGMTLVVTVVSTYLPVLVAEASGPVLVGLLISGEGFFGIFVPAVVGARSDRFVRRVRDRVPLLIGFAVVVVAAMALTGVLAGAGAHSAVGFGLILLFLYAGYYAFLAPFWALYPDLVPDEQSNRSRAAEGTLRVTGTGLALVAGGVLLDVWTGLPFLAGAVVCALSVLVLLATLRSRRDVEVRPTEPDESSWRAIRSLAADSGIARMCLCEGLWNFALSALRTFVVLYFTMGLGRSSTFVSTVIFPLVAVGIGIAAPSVGALSDRYGSLRVLLIAAAAYAVGMALPTFFQSTWVVALIPFVAMGAATVMTMPFAVLMRMIPESRHGAASGLFGFSRGLGSTLGPILTGVAIVALDGVFPATHGYSAMWLICAVAIAITVPLLWSLRRDERV